MKDAKKKNNLQFNKITKQLNYLNFQTYEQLSNEADYCQLTRSCSYFNCGTDVQETDIYKSIQWMIQNAQKFLYFENQYILSKDFAQNNIVNLIMDKIKEKILNLQKFRVFIVYPLACEEKNINIINSEILYFGTNSIYNQFQQIISLIQDSPEYSPQQKDFSQIVKFEDYFSYVSLMSIKSNHDKQGLQSVFIHAKVVIADDLYASLGSANWNDRSYLADRDSEMNIFFVKKPNTTEGFAKKLRKNLMKEHLGLDDQDDQILDDPSTDEFFFNIWDASGQRNKNILQQVFQFDSIQLDPLVDFDRVLLGPISDTMMMENENLEILKSFKGRIYATPYQAWSKNRQNINLIDIINKIPFLGEAID